MSKIKINQSNILPIKIYTPPSLHTNISSINQSWITVPSLKDNSSLPPSRTTTPTSPSIPFATANQFSVVNDDNNDEACADSGANISIVKNEVKLNNEVLITHGPSVISATKNTMQAKAIG